MKEKTDKEHCERLNKHLKVAGIFTETANLSDDDALDFLVQKFYSWAEDFNIPKLSFYGISKDDLPKIIQATGQKNNPVILSEKDLEEILLKRL